MPQDYRHPTRFKTKFSVFVQIKNVLKLKVETKGGQGFNLFIKQAGMAPQQGANFTKFEKKKACDEWDLNWGLLGGIPAC